MMKVNNILDIINYIPLFIWIIGSIVLVMVFFFYFLKWMKLQYRFGKNLRRKIYFLKTSLENKDFVTERDQMKNIKLFNVEDDIKDISKDLKKLQNLSDNAVYIVSYDKHFDNYKKLLEKAESKKIPVIIYAEQGEIKNAEHWKIFNSYIFCDVANTSNRLVIMLLNILKIV